MSRTTYIETVAAHIASAVRGSGVPALEIERRTGISRHTLARRLARPDTFTLSELAAVTASIGISVASLFEYGRDAV